LRLKGKIAIVTGGGSGIGKSISMALAKEGAKVVVADVDEKSAKNTATEIRDLQGEALAVRADVTSEEDVKMMLKESIDKYSGIDVIVNNAGIAHMGRFLDFTEADFNRTMNVNVKGMFLCSKYAAAEMLKHGGGKIVNIASVAGKSGFPYKTLYCASKWAVIGLTKSMAAELAQFKINVNAVCPGIIETDLLSRLLRKEAELKHTTPDKLQQEFKKLIPLGRLGRPDDIAKMVIFLCSEDADFITGQAYNVDGGERL